MLKKFINKVELKLIAASRKFMESERGDTNFISIIIILGIVIILAGIFMGFKDTIVQQVQEIMDGFTVH